MTTTFNITPELWQEMRAFSTDSRPRFLYVITHHNPDDSFNMGYSGRKTADTLYEANTYPGSSTDTLFSEERILSHRSEYQFIIVGYCRSTEELGNSEDALNQYMKGFYKKQWANKKVNGKWTTEGLIPIIKKGKKIRFVRPEELEHYKSLGWSKGMMFYKMRKEGEALQEVGEEQVRSLLEAGYFFEGHNSITLHHPEVKGSTIGVHKETGFMEGDVLDALNENFALGSAPKGHQTTADEKTVAKVKEYIEFVWERGVKRMADAKRANTVYTLKKGDETPLEDVSRYDVLGKLKEDYRFTQKSIDICNKAGTVTDLRFDFKGSNAQTREKQHLKLIRLLESGDWQIGSVWEEPVVTEVIEEPVVTEVIEDPVEVVVEEEPVVAEIEEPVVANPVVGEPVVQSAWGEVINFFDSCKDLPRTRKTRYTI